jgi:Fe-S cluster assembly protein SufD
MALWNTGIFVYIPDNMVVEKPIHLQRHLTGENTISRLLVIMGKNSEAMIIDNYSGDSSNGNPLMNNAIELFADDASRLKYFNLQNLPTGFRNYTTQRAHIGQNANCRTVIVSLGGGVSKTNSGTVLDGRGADSRIFGLLFGDEKQKFDLHTMHHHKRGETFSDLDYKVVLKERAVSAYTGLIRIEKDALNCEAYQENRNLLLNKGTKAESIPELEILTDQVRCTHGATMGPIDPEMVFYLQSRGFSRNEAVRAIVSGFMEPTFKEVPGRTGDMIRELFLNKLG